MRPNQDFSIRKATLADAGEILRCLDQAFAPYRDAYTPLAFSDTVLSVETLAVRFTEMRILVAADNSGRVIGTIAYKIEGGEGHVRGMAVVPGRQGSEVAAVLLSQVESDLRDRHCSAVTLDTTKPLQRAIRFYERSGFRATGQTAPFFGMELIAYRKQL
jgi:N-acetylglutamate synthase-like GNAT family acetyltransferase